MLRPLAASPDLKTPSPVIYLADNLDEAQNLGWCIDTVGRGFNDKLHVHSCKPRGGDVQFRFNGQTGQIMSATFDTKCLELVAPEDAKTPFGLVDCSQTQITQRYQYDSETGQFHPIGKFDMCLAAGDSSRQAGPFQSRNLTLAKCDAVDPTLTRWVIKD